MQDGLSDALSPAERLLGEVITYLPTLAGIIAIALVGCLISVALGRAARWIIKSTALETLSEEIGLGRALYAIGYRHGIAQLARSITLWIGLTITFLLCAEAAGLEGLAEGVQAVVAWLPKLGTALVILGAGLYGGELLGRVVANFAEAQNLSRSPSLIAAICRYTVLAVAFTIAFGQMGIETDLVAQMILLVLGGGIFSMALAFAFSIRDMLKNVVAKHYAVQLITEGDEIILGSELQGMVSVMGPVTVTLSSNREDILVPYAYLLAQPLRVLRVSEGSRGDDAQASGER